MTALAFQSAIDIAARIRKRELSSVEALNYFRQRIARFNPALNAIVVFDWERAQTRALQADQALARGESWGPLHGVPITIKESYDLKGHATTWGNRIFKDYIATEDDLIVQRLESSGAVVFGKSNVPLNLMDFQSYNEIYGVTNNPWDVTRGPGGSSGGAAAALAAGLTGMELGSDIGGSIRNPAHYCGVYGHKSTFGLIGTTRGAPPGNLTTTDLAVFGPMARSAEDLQVAMQYLAGPSLLDNPVWRPTLPSPTKQLKEYRVVIWPSNNRATVSSEISARCQQIGDVLAKVGAKVSDKARPAIDLEHSNSVYRKLLESATDPFSPLPHGEWRDLDNERVKLRLQWREFFKDWDIVIAPIAATTAFPHDHSSIGGRSIAVDGVATPYFQQIFWPGLVTVAHLPSTAFPTGPDKNGLPLGLQAFGDAYQDLVTIDFTRLLAKEIGGYAPPNGYED